MKLPPGLEATSSSSVSLCDELEKLFVDGESIKVTADDRWNFSLVKTEWQVWRNSLIGEVIECIDEIFGLDVPVFVFGYAKMRRGISFRSNRR